MFKRLSQLTFNNCNPSTTLTTHATHNMHTKIAIVGGGCAGSTCAAQIVKSGMANTSEITVFDPSPLHWYQPSLTMVSGGILGNNDSEIAQIQSGLIHRSMESMFSPNINLTQDKITEFDPDNNKIYTSNGNKCSYDYLIICTGNELRYDLVEGLKESLEDPMVPVGSMYRFDYAKKVNRLRHKLKGGKAICTMPKMPIKCAGAPIKFLNLADWSWRERGVRNDIDLRYYTTLPQMFGVKKYSTALTKIISERNITPHYNMELIKVDGVNKIAYFRDLTIDIDSNSDPSASIVSTNFDFLHAPPPQKPNKFISNSVLADNTGYINVNKETLQSINYDNVFSLGDCSNVPTAKTAAAVYAQTPIMLHNMKLIMNGVNRNDLNAKYDGYTSCPIFVGNKKLMLAEFKFGGAVKETFPFDQGNPNTFCYYLKRYGFPYAYWNLAPKAMWYGTNAIFEPKWKSVAPPTRKAEQNAREEPETEAKEV